jgi:hypothetical protein
MPDSESAQLNLSAPDAAISEAESQLGVLLPNGLKEVWRISNGLHSAQDWRVYPVFDRGKPKKS